MISKTQIIGLVALIISHVLLIISFKTSNADTNYVFYASWIFGIISVLSNIFLADKLNCRKWQILILIVSGIFWFFPLLLITFFGIPFLIIFLISAILIQIKGFNNDIRSKTA